MAWAFKAVRQAVPVKLVAGAVSHAGGAGRFFDHALTECGQRRSQWPLWPASEVFPVLEAVKVEGRTPDRPLTDFGPLWTDRRRLCVVVRVR